MLPIIDMISPVNPYSRPAIKLKHGVRGIVMHYTASPGAPAKNIDAYFDRLAFTMDRYAGAHFSVDDTSIIQSIPESEMAYHCGSKTYTDAANARFKPYGRYPNNCTIGIEMCIDSYGNITEKTFKNCGDLVAYLLKKYNLTINDIWTHKGIVGWKDCPLPWVKNPAEFERFKKEVSKKIQPKKEVITMEQVVASWAKEAQKWVTETKDEKGNPISDGTRPEDQVTRQELWTMLHRVYKQLGGK